MIETTLKNTHCYYIFVLCENKQNLTINCSTGGHTINQSTHSWTFRDIFPKVGIFEIGHAQNVRTYLSQYSQIILTIFSIIGLNDGQFLGT